MVDRRFDEELNDLNNKLLRMAALTQESIYLAVEALKHRDKTLAERVIDNDKAIDAFELDIDDFSIELLARRQPLAGDLRFIAIGMKINGELERIADLSVNIAHRALDLSEQPLLKPLVDIPVFSQIAITMVKETIDAFVTRDAGLAEKVIKMDAEANNMRDLIHKKLVTDYIAKDVNTISRALSLFLVAQHLERICDHAKYIAEAVIYLVSARVVKHSKISKDN
jgi:phosphate transport system protein